MRRSKYGNKKTVVDGIVFDSKSEAARYSELVILQRTGDIRDLRLQPAYELTVAGVKICKYIADFSYVDLNYPHTDTVEDRKGYKTAVYRIKKKLFQALFPEYRFVES